MPQTVTLKNRLPEIIIEMNLSVPKAMEIGAASVAEMAKSRVPVDTGALQDAIHVEKLPSGSTFSNWAVVAGSKTVFYGHIIEHGGTSTPAHPYLVPSFEALKPEIEALVRAALKRL